MTKLYFLAYPQIERKKAKPVTEFGEALKAQVNTLYETMEEAQAWCLAAPQVGMDLSVFVLSASSFVEEKTCFINPQIVEKEGVNTFTSDCLYFPGVETVLKRPKKITIQYFNELGQSKEMVAENELAALMAYQVDCLNGVLVIDHMSKLKKERFLKKYEKALANQHHCGTSCDHDHHHH